MLNKNYRKGLVFGIICIILTGLEPIIALSRPAEIDAMLFASMTCLIQALLFFPIMILERKKIKSEYEEGQYDLNIMKSLLYGYQKNKIIILGLGIIYAIALVLFFSAIGLAGAINASIATKTSIFFGLLFGFLFYREQISITQIIFSLVLFFGLLLVITQGSFNLLEFNIGVVIMIIAAALFMFSSTLTKLVMDRKEITPVFLVFVRNALGGLILIVIYTIIYHFENYSLILIPINIFFFFIMGAVYCTTLYFYYLTIKYIKLSTSTILLAPTPLVTSFFAMLIFGEQFTIFHLIGSIIIISSIIVVAKPKK